MWTEAPARETDFEVARQADADSDTAQGGSRVERGDGVVQLAAAATVAAEAAEGAKLQSFDAASRDQEDHPAKADIVQASGGSEWSVIYFPMNGGEQ